MKCICQKITELEGNDALDYAENHLEIISIDKDNWQTLYECPVTGIQWLKDYPDSEYHGGGSPRLRKMPIKSDT
jgi:hypothetical protein